MDLVLHVNLFPFHYVFVNRHIMESPQSMFNAHNPEQYNPTNCLRYDRDSIIVHTSTNTPISIISIPNSAMEVEIAIRSVIQPSIFEVTWQHTIRDKSEFILIQRGVELGAFGFTWELNQVVFREKDICFRYHVKDRILGLRLYMCSLANVPQHLQGTAHVYEPQEESSSGGEQ